jgi:uncharacterized membrane protein
LRAGLVAPKSLLLCRAAEQGNQPSDQQQQAQPAGSPTASSGSNVELQAAASATNQGSSSMFPYNAMAVLASAGAAETLYLIASKLLNASVACPTSGCDAVLSSPYAQLFGVPLPLLGVATYTAVAVAAGIAASTARSGRAVPSWLSSGLAAGVCGLAATSAYLMYILQTQLGGAPCVWCWASAAISGALFSSLIAGMDKRQMADAAGPGLGATAAALAVLYAGFGPLAGSGISNAAELELPYVSPAVTTESSEQTLSLAHRLREAGAVMYGAFWCRWVLQPGGSRGRVLQDCTVEAWLEVACWLLVPVHLCQGRHAADAPLMLRHEVHVTLGLHVDAARLFLHTVAALQCCAVSSAALCNTKEPPVKSLPSHMPPPSTYVGVKLGRTMRTSFIYSFIHPSIHPSSPLLSTVVWRGPAAAPCLLAAATAMTRSRSLALPPWLSSPTWSASLKDGRRCAAYGAAVKAGAAAASSHACMHAVSFRCARSFRA